MSTSAAAANGWRRYGHRWFVAVIVIIMATEEDVTMLGNEDW